MVSIPPFPKDRVKWDGFGWGRGLFLSLKEAYISNLSLLLCLAWKQNFVFSSMNYKLEVYS